jgi:adenine phosphoribosyltransferase
MTESARALVLDRFRWVEGHADVWRVFADADALRLVVAGLAAPWQDAGVTHVAGIEARGFLLGGAVAVALGAGFVAIRKDGTGLLPGPKVRATADEDYRGNRHELRMQAALSATDRVLLVDDWAERGSQASAARELVRLTGAEFLGVSVVVDMLPAAVRADLGRVTTLVEADELGPSQ